MRLFVCEPIRVPALTVIIQYLLKNINIMTAHVKIYGRREK